MHPTMAVRRCMLALCAIGSLALAAPSADAAGVRAAGRLPLVAAAAGQIELILKVSGGAPKLGLVLSRSARTAKRGIKLGRPGRARARRRHAPGADPRLDPGLDPPGQAADAVRLHEACTNVAAGVRTGKGCRALGKLPTSGPGLQQRLDAAVAAHRLSRGQAALYGLYAMNTSIGIPLRYSMESIWIRRPEARCSFPRSL